MRRRLKILTWHTHGSYLYYLTQAPHEFYVLSKPDRPPGYGGRCGHIPWGDNVIDLPVSEAKDAQFDCILFQDDDQFLLDQHLYLSDAQRRLPKIYLEHDPPREHPTDMRHPIDDPSVLLVHVTPFNALMWECGRTPQRIVEHGVIVPNHVVYRGELARGLAAINHLATRGRRLGEIEHAQLPAFAASYRFFFHPARYSSLGLAVIEAMMIGMPIVALATTEMATVIDDGVSGYINTDVPTLIACMQELLANPAHAAMLGDAARRRACERFHIGRFVRDWDRTFRFVTQF